MKALVEFECHDYMDEYPTKEVRIFKGSNLVEIIRSARDWADYMNQNYSGGTTTYKQVLTPMESIDYLTHQLSKALNHPTVTRSNGDLDSVDAEYIKKLVSILQDVVDYEVAEMAKLS